MKAMTWVCRALLGLGAVSSFVGCSSSGSDGSEGLVGVATLAVAAAPSDVNCIRITVAGARTVVQNLPVMPGQSTVFPLNGLPVGNDTFTGEGFGGACPPAAGAVANWASAPTAATVNVNPPVNVTITMVRNGRSTVGVDFQDDTGSCADMIKNGSETDIDCGGGVCAPCGQGRACNAAADCNTGICTGGLCGGCLSNADCPAGAVCDPTVRQCVGACPAPRVSCGGACVDVSSDPQNCGMCGRLCSAGTACVNGACTGTMCAAGQVLCANVCVNPSIDPNNCGACGLHCAPGLACNNGACTMAPNSCTDGIRDNGESGVDCGGPTPCPRCPVQQTCVVASDCASQHCLLGLCSP